MVEALLELACHDASALRSQPIACHFMRPSAPARVGRETSRSARFPFWAEPGWGREDWRAPPALRRSAARLVGKPRVRTVRIGLSVSSEGLARTIQSPEPS